MNRRCIFGLPKSHHLGPAYRGFAGRGSYLRISCRHWGRRTTAEDDPSPTPTVHRSVMLFCAGWREVICSRIMLRSVNFNLNKIVSFHN